MSDQSVNDRIKQQIGGDDVVLYMKGTPVFPMCGFSAAVVQVLSREGVKFQSYNILEDQELRQGLKAFSDWPTFPQLYVKGELVGGCDIVREMHEAGELEGFLKEKGVKAGVAAPSTRKALSRSITTRPKQRWSWPSHGLGRSPRRPSPGTWKRTPEVYGKAATQRSCAIGRARMFLVRSRARPSGTSSMSRNFQWARVRAHPMLPPSVDGR